MRREQTLCDLCASEINFKNADARGEQHLCVREGLVSNGHDKVFVDVCNRCLKRPISELAHYICQESYRQNGRTAPE